MTIELKGRIDSLNSKATEQQMLQQLTDAGDEEIILDMAELEMITSAGLRVILRLRQT